MPKRPYDSRYWREMVRPSILRRDNYQCQLRISKKCKQVATQVHHLLDWQDGGSWYSHTNLTSVCQPCNLTAKNRRAAEAVRRERNTLTTPTPSRAW